MAVGGTVVMANAVAQSLLTPAEQQSVQDHTRHFMGLAATVPWTRSS